MANRAAIDELNRKIDELHKAQKEYNQKQEELALKHADLLKKVDYNYEQPSPILLQSIKELLHESREEGREEQRQIPVGHIPIPTQGVLGAIPGSSRTTGNVEEEQKVHLASLYLEGRADVWYHDYQEGKPVVTWEEFTTTVNNRFQELGHDDIVGEFNKLSQVWTVLDYQESFEELKALMLAKNRHLTEEYFTSSFISGLKEELRMHVLMFSPKSLASAIYLARMKESLLELNAKKNKSSNGPLPIYTSNYNTHKNLSSPMTSPRLPKTF
ncbi:uncharacterized protein LOC113306062 [Papaver somniferum]|uniref:uncharacterized protein LOC113306062 n=1 Tax=Papaver somniferum TaxID=3469 RepID=UPI000E6FE233|nr:uncharacterized protein LOC113306062 [Papaver somniferum]